MAHGARRHCAGIDGAQGADVIMVGVVAVPPAAR